VSSATRDYSIVSDKFSWEPVRDPSEWDRLIDHSPQATVFSERVFLDLAARPYDLFLVRQGEQCKAGVAVLKSDDGRRCILDDVVIHNGILFWPDSTKKPVRLRLEQLELTQHIICALEREFQAIALSLSPAFPDLRAFQWHNYHNSDPKARFTLDLRYTSYVNIVEIDSEDEEGSAVFRAMDTLRQRHIRDARRHGGTIRSVCSSARLIEYYGALMARQDAPVGQITPNRIGFLIDGLIQKGRAAVFEVVDGTGTVPYVVAYAWDAKRAYYLFGAGVADADRWPGTFAHWGAFRALAERASVTEVDFEGVNSPRRGWFKLGFGGDLRPYYHVYKGVSS
jgi:hypothetical protein